MNTRNTYRFYRAVRGISCVLKGRGPGGIYIRGVNSKFYGSAVNHTPLHKALLVGDKSKVMGFLDIDTAELSLSLVFAGNGEAALEMIRSGAVDPALVISDQRLAGMAGTDFLETVKEISPDTVRLLLTRYSDMDIIKESVNRGAVHRYILKAKNRQDTLEELRMGLNQYEMQMEAKADLEKAKHVNRQLYQLDSELIDSRKSLEQAHEEIDREIESLDARVRDASARIGLTPDQVVRMAEIHLDADTIPGITPDKINRLYAHAVTYIFDRFEEFSKRNGFKMQKPGLTESHDRK